MTRLPFGVADVVVVVVVDVVVVAGSTDSGSPI
jgi:hypothetical protein